MHIDGHMDPAPMRTVHVDFNGAYSVDGGFEILGVEPDGPLRVGDEVTAAQPGEVDLHGNDMAYPATVVAIKPALTSGWVIVTMRLAPTGVWND